MSRCPLQKGQLSLPPTHLMFGVWSTLLGFALILGGPQRATDAYEVVFGPRGAYVWGTVLVLIGSLLMVSVRSRSLMQAVLLAGCAAYWFLATAFLAASVLYPQSPYSAAVVYGGIASLHFCAWWHEWGKDRDDREQR